MTDTWDRHETNPFDPTDKPESDPVPTGEDVVNRQNRGHNTPRRYEEPAEDVEPSGTSKERKED